MTPAFAKYKLIPFLALSKEDAKVEAMQDALTEILKNPKLDSTLKLALFEELLKKISQFKTAHAAEPVPPAAETPPAKPVPPPVKVVKAPKEDSPEPAFASPTFESPVTDWGTPLGEPYGDVTIKPLKLERSKERQSPYETPHVNKRKKPSPPHTRSGRAFGNMSLFGN